MVYKYIDIVIVSSEGITEAVNDAVVEAAKSVKNLRWAEVGMVTQNRRSKDARISGRSEDWFLKYNERVSSLLFHDRMNQNRIDS